MVDACGQADAANDAHAVHMPGAGDQAAGVPQLQGTARQGLGPRRRRQGGLLRFRQEEEELAPDVGGPRRDLGALSCCAQSSGLQSGLPNATHVDSVDGDFCLDGHGRVPTTLYFRSQTVGRCLKSIRLYRTWFQFSFANPSQRIRQNMLYIKTSVSKPSIIKSPVGMNITRRPPQGLERQGRTRGYSYQRDCLECVLTQSIRRRVVHEQLFMLVQRACPSATQPGASHAKFTANSEP
eukprot:scaffold110740_cov67-Phaeocystis_antarctica.AAC.2